METFKLLVGLAFCLVGALLLMILGFGGLLVVAVAVWKVAVS